MTHTTHSRSARRFRRWSYLLVALLAASLLGSFGSSNAGAAQPVIRQAFATTVPAKISGTKFVDENGAPVFLMGVNYVGHTDRAWLVWEDGKFDPGLIDAGFGQAERAGLNTVRIFVQKTLRDNINANNWSKLDKVIELAGRHRLRLLLTFNDYDEPNLAKEADFNRKVVDHYKANPVIFGYDLKNEPQFGDIATADYPAGVVAPLQDDAFIKAYGERMSNDEVKQWRQTAQGKAVIPARFDDRRAYLYANAYKLYVEFLNDSSAWVLGHSGKNSLDYIDSPDSGKWKTYLEALSGTLGKFIEVRAGAIRAASPSAPVTIGWSNSVLAKMGANNGLSFVSLHRFVDLGLGNLNTTINLLENLRITFSLRPVVLEEFGYSNSRSDGTPVDLNATASYETTLWLYLYTKGFAGGMKWMLVNYPPGYNKVENNFGLLDDNSQPKPAYHGLRAVATLAASQGYAPGTTNQSIKLNGSDLEYRFDGPLFFFTNAKSGSGVPGVSYSQAAFAPFASWLDGPDKNHLNQANIMATQEASVRINVTSWWSGYKSQKVRLFADGQLAQETLLSNGILDFTAKPGVLYLLQVPVTPEAFNPAQPIAGQNYYKETGHNLGGRFLAYWQQHGGLSMFGFPISEQFQEFNPTDGKIYTVQYFERNRFEYHPEFAGTKYEVLLGLLGRQLTAGRESEAPFQRIGAFPGSRDRLYFPETGHSLAYGFKNYWEKNGGLAQFGFPITEEFSERNPTDGKTYTVQYFERARFEYHPEFQGTQYEVLLGHLGWQLVRLNGYLP